MKIAKLIKSLFSSDEKKDTIEIKDSITKEIIVSRYSKQYYRGLIVKYCRLSDPDLYIYVNDASEENPADTFEECKENLDGGIETQCLKYLLWRFERCEKLGDASDYHVGTTVARFAYGVNDEKKKAQFLLDFFDNSSVEDLPLEDAFEDASIFNQLGETEISMRLLDYAANNSFPMAMITKAMISGDEIQFKMWLERAIETGDATAQYEAGTILYYGDSILGQDYLKAKELFTLAANQGHPQAQCNLGVCYYYGQGCKIDYEEAIKWYKLSAEQNEANAFYNLGTCYRDGHGVDQDLAMAISYYEKAAFLGHPEAESVVGALTALVKQMNNRG